MKERKPKNKRASLPASLSLPLPLPLRALSALLCALMLFALAPRAGAAAAYTKATYEDVKNSTTEEMRKQIEELRDLLDETKESLARAEEIKATAAEKREIYLTMQALYEDSLKYMEGELILLEKEADDIAVKIASLEVEYEKSYDDFLRLIKMSYEEGEANYIEIILGASDLSDLLSRIERVSSMMKYSEKVMNRLSDEKAELSAQYDARVAKAKEQSDRIEVYEGKQRELEEWQAANEAELSAIEGEIEKLVAESENYTDRTDVLDAEFQKMVDELEAAENKKRAEAAERARQAAIAAAEKRRLEEEAARLKAIEEAARNQGFLWPLPNSCRTVSSQFGMRLHPVYGKYQMHYGVDLPGPKGTPVYASKDGKVTVAKYHVSYGYYILIDHINGTSTLYAHLDTGSLKVKAGDTVRRGQQIAGIGTTGVSTGYHLHFEVRVNGECVDPLKYAMAPANLVIW